MLPLFQIRIKGKEIVVEIRFVLGSEYVRTTAMSRRESSRKRSASENDNHGVPFGVGTITIDSIDL
jgi:hypothetical protein